MTLDNYTIFDIETGPLPASHVEAMGVTCDKAALCAMTGRVLAIGIWRADTGVQIWGNHAGDDAGEARLLQQMKALAQAVHGAGGSLVGWASSSFDIPFLLQRFCILGLGGFLESGFAGAASVDLRDVWTQGVSPRPQTGTARNSLANVARALQTPHQKSGSGADFARRWLGCPEEKQQAFEYLENDILVTKEVAERILTR